MADPITDEAIEKLVTSQEPRSQAFGRLLATGVTKTIDDFEAAEMARGTEDSALKYALFELGAMMAATSMPEELSLLADEHIDKAAHSFGQLAAAIMAHSARRRRRVLREMLGMSDTG